MYTLLCLLMDSTYMQTRQRSRRQQCREHTCSGFSGVALSAVLCWLVNRLDLKAARDKVRAA